MAEQTASSKLRTVFRAGVAAFGVLAAVGFLASDLIASDVTLRYSEYCGFVLAAIGCAAGWSRTGPLFDMREERTARRFAASRIARNDWSRAAVCAALAYGLGIGATGHGAPWLYTVLQGVQSQRVFTVAGWNAAALRQCSRPRFEETGRSAPRRGPCFGTRLPTGTKLIVAGQATVLGIRAEDVAVVPQAPANAQ